MGQPMSLFTDEEEGGMNEEGRKEEEDEGEVNRGRRGDHRVIISRSE